MSCCNASLACANALDNIPEPADSVEEQRLRAASKKLAPNRYSTQFIVPDIHCAACIGAIERGLAIVGPVEQVRANLSLKTVSVVWNPEKGNVSDISIELDKLGFGHHTADYRADEEEAKSKSLLLALAVAGFAAANIMLLSVSVWSGADAETARLFHLISGIIAVPAVAFSGQPFFRSALRGLSVRKLNMDVPISLAVLLALGMSVFESLTGGNEAFFDASVTLLFFLLIGRYLDNLMRKKARGAVERLASLNANGGVLVQQDGETSHISLQEIKPGMNLRVFPGERFPVDGKIRTGVTALDRSHVTGESESVDVCAGSMVEAGTMNLTAVVDYEATADAENSFLADVRKMMEAAEAGRNTFVRIADRMAQIYAPAVHLLALITFIGWMFISSGDWQSSLYTAIAVLIITCPCALGLAVPVAQVIAANRLMQSGIYLRDGTALERLSTVSTAVFDKTGTLTTGMPVVVNTIQLKGVDLALVKAVAMQSKHPNAYALSNFAAVEQLPEIENATEIPGYGIAAEYQGKKIRLGKPEWVAQISAADNHIADDPTLSFAVEGEKAAHFFLDDELRKDAALTISQLENMNIKSEILSGDREAKVRHVSALLGIQKFSFLNDPADKVRHVKNLKARATNVLMIGDGINDAPVLAASDVSMVPATASDIGRHAADLVFVRPSLTAVSYALKIACVTDKIVKQNFGLAILYNCIAVPLAMAGHVTPLVAAIAMSLSSIVVVGNSLRINFHSDKRYADSNMENFSAHGTTEAKTA